MKFIIPRGGTSRTCQEFKEPLGKFMADKLNAGILKTAWKC